MKKSIVLFVLLFLVVGCATTGENNKEKDVNFPEGKAQATPVSSIKQDDTATVLVHMVIEHIHKLPNRRLTVADFTTIDGGESEIGKLIAEKITTKLSQISEIKVIERKQLKTILAEQKLSLSDITAEDEKEVGQILNVDAVISGSVAHLDDYIEINARMIDVTTGEIYCAVNKREKFDLKKEALVRLPQTQQTLISQEFKQRETERAQDPELFSLKEKMRKQLLEVKRQNPREYDHVVKSLRRMERIKKENHRLFLLVTEPQHSPKLKKVKHQNPELSKKVMEMRRQLGFTINRIPAYREVLRRERHQMIRQIKAGRKHVQ